MKISIPNFIRWYPIISLVFAIVLAALSIFTYQYFKVETHIPVTISGVQHLGGDYRIDHFYVNKDSGGAVGEGGGGGIVCCLMLPKKMDERIESRCSVGSAAHYKVI